MFKPHILQLINHTHTHIHTCKPPHLQQRRVRFYFSNLQIIKISFPLFPCLLRNEVTEEISSWDQTNTFVCSTHDERTRRMFPSPNHFPDFTKLKPLFPISSHKLLLMLIQPGIKKPRAHSVCEWISTDELILISDRRSGFDRVIPSAIDGSSLLLRKAACWYSGHLLGHHSESLCNFIDRTVGSPDL